MPFTCSPPNLRIWAERDYNIDKGMTQGENRDGNIISAEGAGLQSDQQIVVYSEWLAHDGSALPEGLSAVDGAQYGLTGRLAKVVGADLLQATGFQGELAEFPIAPGRQTQVLQLNDNLANPEHFYIHVIGKAKNQEACTGGSCADFEYTGSDAGVPAPLDTRPRFITPILTPHYDEESHWLAYREYRRLLREGEDPANGDPLGYLFSDPERFDGMEFTVAENESNTCSSTNHPLNPITNGFNKRYISELRILLRQGPGALRHGVASHEILKALLYF